MDEAVLSQKYDLVKVNIISSTQISKITTTVIAKLSKPSQDDKQVILALTAKARTANKLISIVEIAKRELASSSGPIFQYNAVSCEMVEIPRKSGKRGAKEGDEESDDAFETMGAESLSGTKQRSVPVMTTYVATVSVKELKAAYG